MIKNKNLVHTSPVGVIMNANEYSGAIMNNTLKYHQYLDLNIWLVCKQTEHRIENHLLQKI